MNSKYIVWTSTDNTTWTESHRLVPTNFRRASKGIGAATFTIKKNDQINETFSETLTPGLYIAIGDVVNFPTRSLDTPTHILWKGKIKSVSGDTYEGSIETTGVVSADEIGVSLYTNPITQDYPIFNPIMNGKWTANKVAGDASFLKRNFPTLKEEASKWPEDVRANVWTLKDVLTYLVGITIGGTPKWPWEWAGAGIESQHPILVDNTRPRSYPTFYGQSIGAALDSLIDEPLGWTVDYNSSFSENIVIYNKSAVFLPVTVPAAPSMTISISGEAATINFSQQDDVYDRVTVRGSPVMWTGTLHTLKVDALSLIHI